MADCVAVSSRRSGLAAGLTRGTAAPGRCQYGAAYALMRRHRIRLDLLVDHAPDTFAERCPQLCRALMHQPNWLCVLISELRSASNRTCKHSFF